MTMGTKKSKRIFFFVHSIIFLIDKPFKETMCESLFPLFKMEYF